MIEQVMTVLEKNAPLVKVEGNPHAAVSKNGMHFLIDTYRMGDFGSVCTIRMKAMMGVMKMEASSSQPTAATSRCFPPT